MDHTEILSKARHASFMEELFDRIPDVVFFVKDLEGRYVAVNSTLAERCGATSKTELLGQTTAELFPSPLGESFMKQDLAVCRSGAAIVGRLELHLYTARTEGWCLTDKVPITGSDGAVIGLAGISRDLRLPGPESHQLGELAETVAWLQANFELHLRVDQLAARAGMSEYRLSRRIKSIYGITPGQLITKTRIDEASRLLRETRESISTIAIACGYCDQSAFTRQFKGTVGLTPTQYRERSRHPCHNAHRAAPEERQLETS